MDVAREAIRVTPLGKGARAQEARSVKERLELFDQARAAEAAASENQEGSGWASRAGLEAGRSVWPQSL